MRRTHTARSGYTAVEILIVVTILGILAALVTGAVVRVIGSSEKGATETTLTKLASLLDVHWKATIDSARKEYDSLPAGIKQALLTLADNQTASATTPVPHPRRDDRARLIYVKLRLKQEFPTSFAVALNPAPGYLPAQSLPPLPGTFTGKPAYVKAVYGKTNALGLDKQSSAMLAMAFQQSRAGSAPVALEQVVGATFLRTEAGFTYIIDSWGKPLQFYPFPTAPVATVSDLVGSDPQDPEGLLAPLVKSRWLASPGFIALLHPQTDNRRLIPVIVSSGPDGLLGGSPLPPTFPTDGGFAAADTTMNLSRPEAQDNIFSHRLRQSGARGD